ncbi:MAG: hypothetical protein QNJ49_07270 [Mastigocoleus sp. MO_167.B18]|nr:hypothetical protein [Mastigocoleus sp. MO_167.B18]
MTNFASKGFFAYSSNPIHAEICVEKAIREINSHRRTELLSWKSCSISGQIVIDNVTNKIDESDYFCADITGMSNNVLFELGYATAKKKDIFLILDKSIEFGLNIYRELTCLNTYAYHKYYNVQEIVDCFFSREPYIKREGRLQPKFSERIIRPSRDRKALLYLKGQINTEFSRTISQKISDFPLPYIIDDPVESGIPSFGWYADWLLNVPAVLVEFSSTQRTGFELHNAKCSMIAGLAYGLEKTVIMLVENPYDVPIDYRGLLVKFDDITTLESVINDFLRDITLKAFEFISTQGNSTFDLQEDNNELEIISFGQHVAENEGDQVSRYYLDVWNLNNLLLESNSRVIIGRKGVGKTATLKAIKARAERDPENHVCLIEPIILEIQKLLDLLNNLLDYDKTHLVESAWKFLVYTQLVNSLYDSLRHKKRHISAYTQTELDFDNFVNQNKDLFLSDLSVRFETLAKKLEIDLKDVDKPVEGNSIPDIKDKVSEILHVKAIGSIKAQLSKLFAASKLRKIVILIDNLDKAWQRSSNFEQQSLWILGLLNVSDFVVHDLSKIRSQSTPKITCNLTLFLRSDIFKYIQNHCPEPDKINCTYLKWNNKEILFRAIDKRLTSLNDNLEVLTFWQKYIVESIGEEPIKDYIFNRILPRPRDLIYFLERANSLAVNKGHSTINSEDIEEAYKEYSDWIASYMRAESEAIFSNQAGQFSDFLIYLGENQIVSREEIIASAKKCNFISENEKEDKDKIDNLIDHLVDISVLARETKHDIFEYTYDFDNKKQLILLAE